MQKKNFIFQVKDKNDLNNKNLMYNFKDQFYL